MSRELLGFAMLALVCIMISPYYKEVTIIKKITEELPPIITRETTIKSKSPKTIVLLSDSFLPTTFAGSELSGYETIKYLRARGHTVCIFVKEYEVSTYDNFNIYKYDKTDKFCVSQINNSDYVFFQMYDDPKNFEIIQNRSKPVYLFIHMTNSYRWILQQRVSFPISVIYNSHMTQDSIPTLHDNMRMVPYVEMSKFKALRTQTIQNNTVCLINCNKNKGGDLLIELAKKMPNVQFLGVKGGYSDQVVDKSPPSNLSYIENQTDIIKVFKKIGILIMPSKNETWGRTAVEAMASGVPVIHSEAPGLVECVSGAGILCVHDDIDAWVDAINRIIGDPAYREHLRQYGFKRVAEIEKEQTRGRQELAMKIER